MNWGYKILMVYGAFVISIVFMVIKSSNEKTDLVTPDYYTQELKYQDRINETNHTAALSEAVQCEVKDNELLVHFPKDFTGKQLTGTAVLYCPADKNKDITTAFSIANNQWIFPLTGKNSGQYELQLSWQCDSVSYYFTQKIFL